MAFDWSSEIKRAVIRRVVYALLALAFAWFGMGRAYAQSGSCYDVQTHGQQPSASPMCPDRGAAYENVRAAQSWKANSHPDFDPTRLPPPQHYCPSGINWCYYEAPWYQVGAPNGSYNGFAYRRYPKDNECTPPKVWNPATNQCEGPKNCSAEPPFTFATFSGVPASGIICQSECEYHGTGVCVELNRDGETWTTCVSWTPTGQSCTTQVGEQGSPPPDTDGDGSSDGNDTSPNNPGQGGGGPNGPSNEDEGGKGGNGGGTGPGGGQGNGAGEGSGNGNTAGGGQDCATPPSVTGDAALAMIAYQAWSTRCEVTGLRADVGGGDGLGNGDGDGDGDGQGDGDSTVDIPPGDEADLTPEEGDEPTVHIASIGANLLDTSGFLGGGACPSFGAVTFAQFGTYDLQADWFCDWLPIFRGLIILMATFTALRILLGEV